MTRTPTPTPAELQTWGALAVAAEAVAARPTQAGAQVLARLAKEAKRSVTPIQPPSRTNLFVRLVVLALRYAGETTSGRAALAEELAGVAAAAIEHLASDAAGRLEQKSATASAARLPYAEG